MIVEYQGFKLSAFPIGKTDEFSYMLYTHERYIYFNANTFFLDGEAMLAVEKAIS